MSSQVLPLLYTLTYAVASLPNVRVEMYQQPPNEDRWLVSRNGDYLDSAGRWTDMITFYDTLDDAIVALGHLFPAPKKRRIIRESVGYEIKERGRAGVCPVTRCRRSASPRHCGLCVAHYMLRWRMENPLLAAYNTLRDHAKERRIPFTISFDYFCGVADSMSYAQQRGSFKGMLTIDRVEATAGYVPGNLQVLPVEDNSSKARINREKYLPQAVQDILADRRKGPRVPPAPPYDESSEDAEWKDPF
jgi:hypothetical protein